MKFLSLSGFIGCALGMALGAGFSSPAHSANFVIGEHTPLSGKLARVGTGSHRGVMTGIKVLNDKYAGQHTFELKTIDDESSPAKAVSAVEKLASEGVIAFSGGYASGVIGPASEAANKAQIPYITFGGVASALSKRGHEGFFRINSAAGYGKAIVGLVDEMGLKSVSIAYSNKEATHKMAGYIEKKLSEKGLKVSTHEYDAHVKDFKSIVNKIKLRDRSEAILMVGYESEYVGILRAAKLLKPDVKAMIGVWSLATGKMAKEFPDLMENVYGTAMLPFPVSFNSPKQKLFYEAFKANFKDEPSYLEQFGYVQTRLLGEAIVRAFDKNELNLKGIAEELRKTDEETVSGRVRFDEHGDNPEFVQRVGQHQKGTIPLVWPATSKTGEKVFPGTPWQ
ncbi:ABC transporter substrate-binding protein [Terasakiella sp.]|uniref:ABC transporter substrate-binding protein n=1 Tax=Terasakiella sp. TaxID=2034861 RepID=UPI003AA86E03